MLLPGMVRVIADVVRQAAAVAARAAAVVRQAPVVAGGAEAGKRMVRTEVELVLPIGRSVGAHMLVCCL